MSNSKIILITGASSGIGRETARVLVEHGYKVALTARSEDKLKALVDELGDSNAYFVKADASKLDELEQVVEKSVAHFGQLDAVFANAGMGVSATGTEGGDPQEWDKMIDINIKALTYTAKLTMKHLRKTEGHFIITSSIAGKITLKGSIYGATKWFAYGFGKNLSAEMKEWGGRCTTICPGMVNTEFFDEAKPDKLDPRDVADAVLYSLTTNERCNIDEITLMPTK
ncbi:SDR family oxidoreductase [Alteromonas sp. W364]|uniref:SDR family oxidoreductase n=1 Tax=Alteromonas sp. W364 TaxID=3075610 RepID=UPI0028843AF1|nr:SDR family oxidoreductase [Alteromonas sp. W364]MDT0629326.1 SDR family oxidoreductase [Alteromonas sp. W364]